MYATRPATPPTPASTSSSSSSSTSSSSFASHAPAPAGAPFEHASPPWRVVADLTHGTLVVRNEAPWPLADVRVTVFDTGGSSTVADATVVEAGRELTVSPARGRAPEVVDLRWRDRPEGDRRAAMVRIGVAGPGTGRSGGGPGGATPATKAMKTMKAAAQKTSAAAALPPSRLAQLLREARAARAMTTVQVSLALGGRLLPDDIERYERGELRPPDHVLRALSSIYHGTASDFVPPRGGLFVLPPAVLRRRSDQVVTASSSEVLKRYLAAVYHLRRAPLDQPIPLRGADLAVLAAYLDMYPDEVRSLLEAEMGSADTLARFVFEVETRPADRRLNITVATTAKGALVLTRRPTS